LNLTFHKLTIGIKTYKANPFFEEISFPETQDKWNVCYQDVDNNDVWTNFTNEKEAKESYETY